MRQVFDDGSWLELDQDGTVTAVGEAVTTPTYYSSPAYVDPRAPVLDQFIAAALGGVSAAFNRAVNPPTRTTTTTGIKAPANTGLIILLIGAAILLPKLLKG